MNARLFLTLWVAVCLTAFAEDIAFNNRTASFTNLQGQVYNHVQLVRGDLDGLIWRDGASGCRICYTNLAPGLLESLGIPTNRIELAKVRAQQKALADARYRALTFATLQPKPSTQAVLTNSTTAVLASPNAPVAAAGPAYDASYPYGQYQSTPWFYVPLGSFGPTAPSAPSAATAPSAAAAPNAPPAANVPLVPAQPPAAYGGRAFSAPMAASAPSAPPAFVPAPPARRGR